VTQWTSQHDDASPRLRDRQGRLTMKQGAFRCYPASRDEDVQNLKYSLASSFF
jgi:hypothetical protein